MSGRFQPLSSQDTLEQIQARLSQGIASPLIIEELLPGIREEAFRWAHRLTSWDEFRRQYPDQAIALARLISLQAMRAFDLTLREDGRVVERLPNGKPWRTPAPALTFRLDLAGEQLRVEYTSGYFPNTGTELISFLSPHEPPRPHCLSATGCLATFVPHDAVEACGGATAYAALLADALLRRQGKEFRAALEGASAEAVRNRRRKAAPLATAGEHCARLTAQPDVQPETPRQRTLF